MTDKTILRLVTAISIFVFAVVVILNRKLIPVTIPTPSFVYFLPKLNAIINGTCSVLLLVSLYLIKNKNVSMHKRLNILTFVLSSVFLVSYILFHYFVKETTFGGTGTISTFYYTILVSHIILAAAVLPLVL
jgi:putative membrane protein